MRKASTSQLIWIKGTALSMLLALPLAGLHAQEQQSEPYQQPPAQAQPPQQQAVEVNEAKLKKFAHAAEEVQVVQEKYVTRIQSTQDESKANELRQKAQEKMVSAVEDAGLTPNEYNMISMQLQSDPALMERFQAIQPD